MIPELLLRLCGLHIMRLKNTKDFYHNIITCFLFKFHLSHLTSTFTFVVSYLAFFTKFALRAKGNNWRIFFFAAFQTIVEADNLRHLLLFSKFAGVHRHKNKKKQGS
jgi:hypothetical protein